MRGRVVSLVLGGREERFCVRLFVEGIEEGAIYIFLVEWPWEKGRVRRHEGGRQDGQEKGGWRNGRGAEDDCTEQEQQPTGPFNSSHAATIRAWCTDHATFPTLGTAFLLFVKLRRKIAQHRIQSTSVIGDVQTGRMSQLFKTSREGGRKQGKQ